MTSRQRTLTGAALAVLVIPAVLGILACLPLPIGDPEKSRIDPELSGLWLKWDDDPGVMAFEPWDDRTWLVTNFIFSVKGCMPDDARSGADDNDDESTPTMQEHPAYDNLIAAIRSAPEDCGEPGETFSYKVWLTRLGDTQFTTWEPKGLFDGEHGFEPELWFGFRVEKVDANEIHLWGIDIDNDAFAELKENESFKRLEEQGRPRDPKLLRSARRALEKVLKRRGGDPEMFEEDPMVLFRIRPEDYDLFLGDLVPTFD